jgi:hypothetical protein
MEGLLLDEFVAFLGYWRKFAICLLGKASRVPAVPATDLVAPPPLSLMFQRVDGQRLVSVRLHDGQCVGLPAWLELPKGASLDLQPGDSTPPSACTSLPDANRCRFWWLLQRIARR